MVIKYKSYKFCLFSALIGFSTLAFSCSPPEGGYERFVFSAENKNIQSYDKEFKFEKPNIRVEHIFRGSFWKIFRFDGCDDMGGMRISFSMQANSRYIADDLGIQIKVIEGTPPDDIFPKDVIDSNVISSGRKIYNFYWLDGNKLFYEKLGLKLEIVAVSKSGVKSTPVILSIE